MATGVKKKFAIETRRSVTSENSFQRRGEGFWVFFCASGSSPFRTGPRVRPFYFFLGNSSPQKKLSLKIDQLAGWPLWADCQFL